MTESPRSSNNLYPTVDTNLIHTKNTPPAPLSEYIEHIWTLQTETGSRTLQEILIPNGRPGFVFCLGQPFVRIDTITGKKYRHSTLYYSMATRPFVIEQQGLARYVGVELKPYGLSAFAKGIYSPNRVMPLSELFGSEAVDIVTTNLRDRTDPSHLTETIVDFLTERVVPLDHTQTQRIIASMKIIEEHRGDVRTSELAQQLRISPSTLRRTFHRYIGISPEQFITVARYASFVETLLLTSQNPSLAATLHGYYDEAHATKDFKKYTGLNKKAFLNICDGLTRIMYSR